MSDIADFGQTTKNTDQVPVPDFAKPVQTASDIADFGIPTQPDFSSIDPTMLKTAQQTAAISAVGSQVADPAMVKAAIQLGSHGAKAAQGVVDEFKKGLDFAALQREIDALSYKQALGDRSPETAGQVKALQAEQAKVPQAGFLTNLISGAAEQGAAGLRAGGMWLLGAATWPWRKALQLAGIETQDRQAELLSQIGSNLGLSKERTTAITQNPITSLGETAKEATAGITGPTYRALVDQGVNPDIASTTSFVLGGVLTAMQAIPAGRLIPGAQRIGEDAFKAAVVSLAQNGSLVALAKLWGTRVATIGIEQAAIGMANATTNVLGQEWARQYSNRTVGTNIPPTSFFDLTKDILTQGATQAAVGTAIGGLTALKEIQPAYEMGTKLHAYVEDIRAARATNVTQGEPPAPAPKALPLPETKAPLEQARVLLEQTPAERNPQAVAETQMQLDAAVKQITANPTPETIPQAIEAAKASDAIEMTKVQTSQEEVSQIVTGQEWPTAGREVAGLAIRSGPVPNTDSIPASFGQDYTVLPGIREVSMSDFGHAPPYSVEEATRIDRLAAQLKDSKEITPLIVAIDAKGPYILEGGHRFDALHQMGIDKFPAMVVIDESNPPVQPTPVNTEQAVKAGVPVPDMQLPIDQPWAKSEMELRNDARETAVQMSDAGDAMNAQEFASLMKQNELPGAEKPLAWYEDQWANMEKQRSYVENAKNDAFLGGLAKDELQTTLKDIADNPDAVIPKSLAPYVEQAKAGMSESQFQSFVADAAKNPSKLRLAIETAMDPQAQQVMQDRIAQSAASKASRIVAADELLKKYDSTRIGELTTSADPEQQKAAALISRLLRAADKPAGSAIAYDYRVQIQSLQDSFSRESGPKLRETRDRLRTYYEQHPDVKPDTATTDLLNQTLVGDMTVKQARDLAEKIAEARDVGRKLMDVKRTQEKNEVEADRKELIQTITKGEPFERTKNVGSVQEKKQRKGSAVHRGEALAWSPLRLIDRFGKAGERLYKEVQTSRDEEWNQYDPRSKPLLKRMKDLAITPRTLAKMYTVPNGDEYTTSDVMAMKWAMEDEGAKAHLIHGNKIDEELAKKWISELPANVSEFADAMAKAEGQDAWDRIVRAYVEDTNSPPPPKVANHYPVRVQDRQYDSPGAAIADDMASHRVMGVVNKRFTKTRKEINPEHQLPMKLNGPALAFESMRQQEHYIASWKIAKRLRAVFGNRDVKEAIRQKYGDSWNAGIESWINASMNPDAFKVSHPSDKMADFFRHSITSSGIVLNLAVLGYNLTGPLMALGDAGPRRLLTSFAKWAADPKGMYDRVTKALPQVKHATIDPLINALKASGPSSARNWIDKVNNAGYKPMELIDMWTRLIHADAVHEHVLDMNPDMSDKDAWYQALLSIQRKQPSGEPQDLPMMYHGPKLQLGLVFTRQLNQIFNMWTADVPNEVKQGQKLKATGDMFAIAITGFLIAMMGSKRLPKDVKEGMAWLADQFIVSIPFVGNTIEPLLIGKGYMSRGSEFIPGVYGMATDIKNMAKEGQSMAERVDATIRLLIDISRFAGLPAVAEKRTYDFLKTGDPWNLVGGRPKP